MLYVPSLLSTQTFLPEPVVFMINSFLLISRPSLYLSVPVMMLTYALAFPPFPHIFIDNTTSPLDLHYAKVKPSSLGLRQAFFSYASQGKKLHIFGYGVGVYEFEGGKVV